MRSGRLNLFADLADPSKGEGAFVPVLPLFSGEEQVNQCDQRGTYPDGDQEVVGSEVALRIEVDQGFIRSSGHIGRLGQTAESLCETDHIREFFPVTALRGWFGNVPAGQVGDGTVRQSAQGCSHLAGAEATTSGCGCRRWWRPWNGPPCSVPTLATATPLQPFGHSLPCRRSRASHRPSACGTKRPSRHRYSPAICSRGRALRSLPRSLASSLAM